MKRKYSNKVIAGMLAVMTATAITQSVFMIEPVTAASNITKSKAENIAYEDAGVDKDDVISVHVDYESSRYEIEFETEDFDYDYEISRKGVITESNWEKFLQGKQDQSKARISKSDAKAIALEHSGVKNAKNVKSKLKKDDGYHYYKVQFKDGGSKYEYKIDAYSGELLEREYDR